MLIGISFKTLPYRIDLFVSGYKYLNFPNSHYVLCPYFILDIRKGNERDPQKGLLILRTGGAGGGMVHEMTDVLRKKISPK